ncbi:kielin/chordin-like protein isoform X2 [Tachypleus tridentatus]|uniref:kielin/chordin-like protein isoform X2 n=1 Tax=Tachypleus tridentatus TaxID=6853 RepID=UPI003FD1D347
MKNIIAETKLIGKKKGDILEMLVTDNEEEILKPRLNGEDKRTSAPKLSSKKKETPETKLGSRTVKSSETKLSSRKKQMTSKNEETLKNTSTSKKEEIKLSNRKEITPEKELTIKEEEVPEILFNIEKKQTVEKVIPLTQENSTKSMIMQKLDIPARKEKIPKMDIFMFEGIKAVVPDCFYIGRRVKSGTKFFLDSSNCTKCSCQLGELRCETKMCQPLPCSNPLPGPCCHYCPEDCLFEEEIFGHNQTFTPDFDPCRKCICKNGQVYCDAVVCPILECETSSQVIPAGQCCATCQETKPTMCLYKSKHFYIGQLWLQHNKESCRSCLCKEGGVVECRVVVCFPRCSYPEKVPTNCCPVCSGCLYLNQTYADGEVFSEPSNVCNTCVCKGGNVTCTKKQCGLPCQHPYHQLGHCCPVCSDCTFEGEHIPNSETVFIAGQECQLCTCKNGNVSCEPVPCPADCILSGTVDFTYRHGNIFQPEADPCVQCICLNGSISCFVTSCEKDCDHGIYSRDQCCSNCDACEYKGAIHSSGETFLSIEGEDCKKCSCKLGTVHCEEETCRELDCPVKHRERLPNSCCSVCSNYTSQ